MFISFVLASLLVIAVTPSSGQTINPDAVFVIGTYPQGAFPRNVTDVRTYPNVTFAMAPLTNFIRDTNGCNSTMSSLIPCAANASCIDLNSGLGIFQCKCDTGFNQTASTMSFNYFTTGGAAIADGTLCPDIDECANSSVCGVGTDTCFNEIGSYTCNCSAGFTYDSANKICNDIDECSNLSLNNCHQNATCLDMQGNFTCACNNGFTGNGVNCTEIDECVTNGITCGPNGNCSDPVGDLYSCICDSGFVENTTADPKECQDIDECTSNPCASNATCTNSAGSFTCACFSGYTGNGVTCTDINECLSNPCASNATCSNLPGSFACECDTGFSGNGTYCEASSNSYCYRLSVTFNVGRTGDASGRQAEANTAVNGFLTELQTAGGFSYQTYSSTLEAVLGDTTDTEFIIRVCLNGTSATPAQLTSILGNFTFTTPISTATTISVTEYNECTSNYANCSTNANCSNTDGDFNCLCQEQYADKSTSGVNGTICELPTGFTCASDSVNVTAFKPYFDNLGISTSVLRLGDCDGTVSGDDIVYQGGCGAFIESNGSHILYQWNLTNVNESASIVIGDYVTIPITCAFLSSLNVSQNLTAERNDILFPEDLNNRLESVVYEAIAYLNPELTTQVTGPVNSNQDLYFQISAVSAISSQLRLVIKRVTTSSAVDSSVEITLMNNDCRVAVTNSNRAVLETMQIIRSGTATDAVLRIKAHYFGQSRTTKMSFEVTICQQLAGQTCNPGCSRRKRSLFAARVKREDLNTGEATAVFERADDDVCQRNCGEEGVCVYDAARTQRCVCPDEYYKREDGTCERAIAIPVPPSDLSTTMIVLIVLGCVLLLLFVLLVVFIVLRKNRTGQKEYEMNYVNTHAIAT